MNQLKVKYSIRQEDQTIGANRFSYEHWVHSHPENRPCDLYKPRGPMASYKNLEESLDWPIDLQLAPRKTLEFFLAARDENNRWNGGYRLEPYIAWGMDIKAHVAEWHFLYGRVPNESSWMWCHFGSQSIRETMKHKKINGLSRSGLIELRRLYPNLSSIT